MIIEYFIGGGADKNDKLSKAFGSTGIMNAVRQKRAITRPDIATFYKGHEEEDDILNEIKVKNNKKEFSVLNITGHSWGGGAAMNLVNRLKKENIAVNELITLDPVALFPFFRLENFKYWVNVYQMQTTLDYIAAVPLIGNLVGGILSTTGTPFQSHSFNDVVATTGGQLGEQDGATNVACNLDHADASGMEIIARLKMNALIVAASK